ncbi:hypothetical protein HHI36_023009 [Cryptolaemus montrouzieri]|uniref:Uncharacterized protein n=1 Tax=Cryptolaemus montrouzieri TaxID=559131 RepID=A0ABD2PG14_9CUCU
MCLALGTQGIIISVGYVGMYDVERGRGRVLYCGCAICSNAEVASLEELTTLIGRNRRFEIRQLENGASRSMDNLVPPTLPPFLFNNGPTIEGQSIPVVSLVPIGEHVDLGKNLECSSSPSSTFNNDPPIEEYDILLSNYSEPDNEPVTEVLDSFG